MRRVWALPRIEFRAFAEIQEPRPVGLVHTGAALRAVRDHLPRLDVVWEAEVASATETAWQALAADVEGEVIYAVGGGLAVDAAKFIASERDLPLVSLPTALSVDAFFTCASGIRRNGCVHYVKTRCPDRVVIDYEVLAAAPPAIRAAGICDVLSIATGSWDWKYAEDQGRQPDHTPFVPHVHDSAQAILRGALDCAASAGRAEPRGLQQLLACLVLEVQLCDVTGHSRPEEGSEHYFAYAVENHLESELPHGHLVGPGILLMAVLQGQDVQPLREALLACNVPLSALPPPVIGRTLRELPDYCRKHDLAYGIAHTLTEPQLEALPLSH